MLQYLPGFGSVTAGGADDGSPINDFTEEPGDAPSPQMRLEAVSPRSAAMCSQRARMGMSPVRSPPSNRSAGSSSPLVFDSPSSASPTRLLQAERQYWAELTGRQVQELHEALQTKTDACLATVEKLKKEIMERLRQDVASVTNDFATLLSSLEQRLRREHQTDLQAAMEAARLDLPPRSSPKDGEGAKGRAILEPEVDGIGGLDLPTSTSKLRQLDGLLEEIGLRVDGLQIKLEEDLATALADERKTRGKAISDVCQYIEHVVALQESDAKSEKRQTDAAVAGLEDRVQVLEVAFNDCLYRTDAGSTVYNEVLSTRPPGRRVTFLLGLFRTSLLNWDVTDARKMFIPTISWGALISLVMLLVSQLYVRAYAQKALNAPEEAEAEAEHSQYSSALTFLQTVRVLRPYFWPTSGRPSEVLMNRIRALTTWLCVVLSKVSNIISPIFLARATNALASALTTRSLEVTPEIWWPLVEYAALVFVSKALKEAQSLVYIRVQQAASIEIADNTFAHLHSLSLDWHLRKKMGQTVRSMDRGIQAAQQTMQYVVLYLIPTLVEALAVALIFVFHFKNLQLAVFVLLNLIAYMYATIKVTLWRKKFRTATTKHDNDLHDRLTDSLVNYETVKYFTAEDYERREYRSLVASYQKTSMATQASLSFLNILQQLIVNFTLCGGMILATLRVLQTNGNLGDFVAVNTYIINVFTPLNFLGTIYNMVVNAIVDMKNFGQLLAEKSEVQDVPNAPALKLQMSPDVPMVAFEQVCFHYSKQPLGRAIKDVNFRIPPGGSLALVGTTGAGKTTITRLLFRFYDVVSGCVRVNGQDVRKVSQKSLRAAIGMVPQDVVLFNSTIAHNLRYGNVDKASEKDIQKAAVDAQLDAFIDQQAQGYETMVGERGLKLSGGEKQRLAIARCLVKDPPIVVLDEATSALDSETEQKIQEALRVLSASRTVIAIAHRLSTIRAYDEICVLQNGEIVERGNHEALLNAGQSYSSMWKRQAAGIMEDPDSPREEETGAGLGLGRSNGQT